ncbi:hypothetical protein DASC09_022060 [Saccharomycopsis crataegensis]|uniref:Uncharacterized protein n=1 Tax=Saccharomycopsis crataegensis TaxID=43959 RepID=A0AAV5QJL9_9ASCO|nr:hypothetical protein DASC09_022060 [Saccharomycopsis crataegensis]
MNQLIDISFSEKPRHSFGATQPVSSSTPRNIIHPSILNSQPSILTDISDSSELLNPSVTQVLEGIGSLTTDLKSFFQSFKSDVKLPTTRKKIIHHPNVKTFLLVYIVKILRILVATLRNRHIKSRLYSLQLRSSNDFIGDIDSVGTANESGGSEDHALVSRLARSIVDDVMSMKSQLQNCIVVLNSARLSRQIDLDAVVAQLVTSNSKPRDINYYYGMATQGQRGKERLSKCCLVCGNPAGEVADSQSRLTVSGMGNLDKLFDDDMVRANGSSYHKDCFNFMNWRKPVASMVESLILL